MGSLFDGISGFGYAWAKCNGSKTVLWASEIEEFPIAVCKRHFGDEETGEVFFTTDDLEALQEALDNKLESLAGIYQMYVSKGEALKIRSKDIADRAKSFEKKADRIKEYIDALMKANGKDDKPLEIGDKKLSYRKSKATNIFDEDKLKEWINSSDENKQKYFKYKEPEIAKKELGDALKQGEKIPGIELVENKNLQIK